jgi:hypothetical protein
MVTSPINPMRYWKLEEIQRMLNKIEGYENVVIEFQCQQADGWNKLNWDCEYGIKERLVNGQWNWLLKHRFVIEAKTELDAHNSAWQEASERLVTNVWRTSINSFRNEQKQANQNAMKNNKLEAWGDYAEEYATRQKQLHKELVDRKLMEMELENTMTEKIDLINIQTNKIQWTETKLWTVSSIFFITLLLLGWFYPMIVLSICVIALCAMLLYVVIWLGTLLLKEILGLDDK